MYSLKNKNKKKKDTTETQDENKGFPNPYLCFCCRSCSSTWTNFTKTKKKIGLHSLCLSQRGTTLTHLRKKVCNIIWRKHKTTLLQTGFFSYWNAKMTRGNITSQFLTFSHSLFCFSFSGNFPHVNNQLYRRDQLLVKQLKIV